MNVTQGRVKLSLRRIVDVDMGRSEMRNLALASLVATGLATTGLPAWAQVTTRIEPRPFYGATVSVEEGVRVFRPLPP
jgi:hypothetical protein